MGNFSRHRLQAQPVRAVPRSMNMAHSRGIRPTQKVRFGSGGGRPLGIQSSSAKGRLDPFAAPFGYDRYLRKRDVPHTAGVDVERSLRIATAEVDVRRGNSGSTLVHLGDAPASRLSSLGLLSILLKIRAPAILHDSGMLRHPASKGSHDVSVPMPSRVGISGPARRGVQCGANSR
jgi:hypothetical protein